MVEKWNITVPSFDGERERTAYIYLPPYYFDAPEDRYPVLYMFDGNNVFFDWDASYGKSWGLKKFMDETDMPFIIVAVSSSQDPDNGRLREYSPFTFSEESVGVIRGIGRTTMDWFAYTLKPEIDANYRTIPDREHTFIAGSSMGGLMSLFALLRYNHVYSGAAALSPSVWTAPDKVAAMIQKAKLDPNTVLYMDYGTEEFANHPGMRQIFNRINSLLFEKEIMITSRIVPRGTHSEGSWERQLPFCMETLLYSVLANDDAFPEESEEGSSED